MSAVQDVEDCCALLQRVRAEYREFPGLSLTEPQMCRILGVDHETCHTLIETLTSDHFLMRNRQGQYVRDRSEV